MNLINLPTELALRVETDTVKPIPNYRPIGTFRFNMDKKSHIESILGDVSAYIMDSSEIVMWEDNE